MPKISIIVPVYNVEQYLPRCIDSILSQTFTDFEVFLIDDGSTDDSGRICDEYAKKDDRIRVFHKENGGVSSARNVGLDNAKGEWVTFIDSDDWAEDDLLTTIINLVNIYDTEYICWNYYIDNEIDRKTYSKVNNKLCLKLSGQDLFKLLLLAVYPPYHKHISELNFDMYSIWNKAYSLFFLNRHNIRFDIRLKRSEDALFNIQCLQRISCAILINKCLTHYIIRKGSALTSFDKNLPYHLETSALTLRKNLLSENKIVMQCYLCRCMGYIYECYKKIVWNNHGSANEKIKTLLGLCKIVRDCKIPLKGNIITLRNKIAILLIRQKAYKLLLLHLYMIEKLKKMLKYRR